jgi:integrase
LGIEAPGAHRIRVRDLEKLLEVHYARKKGGERALSGFRLHILPALGSQRVQSVQYDTLLAYAEKRRNTGAADSTIRNEFAPLRVGLRMLVRSGKLTRLPEFPTLGPENARSGFFERKEFEAVRDELPEELRGLMTAYYWMGWRKRELLSREWRHVDSEHGIIRLEPGETKNGKPRTFHYGPIPELKAVLESQLAYTKTWEKVLGAKIPYVFHRQGHPIKSYDAAWRSACTRAGYPGRIVHDFRRTAVRNLTRAGVPQKTAMEMTGHLTTAIFHRYGIVTETDKEHAAVQLAALHETEQVKKRGGKGQKGATPVINLSYQEAGRGGT